MLSEGPETLQQALQLGRRPCAGVAQWRICQPTPGWQALTGMQKKWAQRRLALAQLPPCCTTGHRARLRRARFSLTSLASIARLPVERQHAAYKQLKQRKAPNSRQRKPKTIELPASPTNSHCLCAKYFTSAHRYLHLQKRRTLNDHLDQAYAFVRNLNQDIAQGRTRSSKNRLAARV